VSDRALIAFAPLVTLQRVNDPAWQHRTMYDPSALTLAPGHTSAPVLVNHDERRAVGTVDRLVRHEDVDGPWLACLATIDRSPGWLQRDTRVSFGYKPAGRGEAFGCEITRRGLITEVSLLSPDQQPAEPLARVLSIQPAETNSTAGPPAGSELLAGEKFSAGEEIIHLPQVIRRAAHTHADEQEQIEELLRRLTWHEQRGGRVRFETLVEHMKRELHTPTR
jgi:hypothetical protein